MEDVRWDEMRGGAEKSSQKQVEMLDDGANADQPAF